MSAQTGGFDDPFAEASYGAPRPLWDAEEQAAADQWAADEFIGLSPRIPAETPGGPVSPGLHWDDSPPPPIEFILANWLARGSAALLAGEGGTGKSLLGQLLCACAALGVPFLGFAMARCTAAYITAEDDTHVLRIRQAAINRLLGVTMADYGDRLTLWSLKGRVGLELGTFDQERRLTRTDLYSEIAQLNAELTCLDNAAHFFAGNEIIRHDVAAFCGLLDRLSMRTNGTVVLLAHTPKSGAEYSGSTGWDAHVRQRMYLSYDEEAADDDLRILKRSKSNYAKRGETVSFRWFQGAFVRDEDLPPSIAQQVALTAGASADNEIFLVCLRERNKQRRAVSEKRSPTFAPSVFAKMPEARGLGKARLEAAMDRLFRINAIERAEVYRDSDRKPIFGLREAAGNGVSIAQDTDLKSLKSFAGNGAGNARATVGSTEAGNGAGNAGQHTHIPKGTTSGADRAPAVATPEAPKPGAGLDPSPAGRA